MPRKRFVTFLWLVVLGCSLCFAITAQELPPIQNFTPIEYGAENQNRGISQSEQKDKYVAYGRTERLVWSAEFDTEELNETNWTYELGDGCPDLCGWGNNEPQWYTRTNHELKNGHLYITARKQDSTITSTRITTKDKFEFQYGRVEARAKLPTGTGVWPAIWMLGSNISEVGWPLCGEIDILEYVGREPDWVFNSLHTQDSHGNTINTKKTKIENIEDGFHIYSVDWSAEKIDFFIDGNLMYTFAPEARTEEVWPFDQPFYLILNLAVGGNFGGPEIDEEIFPQEFIIDYVRVYKK